MLQKKKKDAQLGPQISAIYANRRPKVDLSTRGSASSSKRVLQKEVIVKGEDKKETEATSGKMTDVATGESLPITTVSMNMIPRDEYGVNGISMKWERFATEMAGDLFNLIKSIYPCDDIVKRIIEAGKQGKQVITNKKKANEILERIGVQTSEREKSLTLQWVVYQNQSVVSRVK